MMKCCTVKNKMQSLANVSRFRKFSYHSIDFYFLLTLIKCLIFGFNFLVYNDLSGRREKKKREDKKEVEKNGKTGFFLQCSVKAYTSEKEIISLKFDFVEKIF